MSRALARDQRVTNDAYYTPDDVAVKCVRALADAYQWDRQLRETEPPIERVLEPSVGGGAFVRAARLHLPGAEVTGIDIDPNVAGAADCDRFSVCGFAEATFPHAYGFDVVVGNPPFSHAEEHVRHALSFKSVRYVGFLLRLAFLEGQKRQAFWREHPPRSVHVLAKRPSFTGGATDSAAYGWFLWRPSLFGNPKPELGWL